MPQYKTHPLAEIFPPFTELEFNELVKDIGQHGQRAPITLLDGKILDGVHRYKACLKLHMEPRVRNFTGNDPAAFAISVNLKRRHLTESQRALIGAKLSTAKNGGDRRSFQTANLPTETKAAESLNVSTRSIRSAKVALREAPKREIRAVEAGEKTIHAVTQQIKESKADKDRVFDKFDRVVPDEMVSEWQRATQTGKKLQSLAREIKSILSEGFSGAKQDRLKDVIYAEITNSAISDAEALSWLLSSVIPYAVCPTCQGFNRKSCGLCKKRGWISKFLYNSPAVSKETKAIIERKAS